MNQTKLLLSKTVFHGLHKGDLLTPIRATENTRRVLIAGRWKRLSRMPCSRLESPRFRCRNHDCCNNTLPRCNQAFACGVQVQGHGEGCDTSWERGSEMFQALAPTCLIFPNYQLHWRTVNDLNPTFAQVQTVLRSIKTCKIGHAREKGLLNKE